MNRKNTFKIVIAFVVVLALVLPSSAMFANVGTINKNVSSSEGDNNIDMQTLDGVTIDNNIKKLSGSDVDWWPMYHHDLRNTGYSTSSAPSTNNKLWSYETDDQVYSSPAVVDGRVFVGSDDDYFYCLDASDGSFIWKYATGGGRSSPAVIDNNVFFMSSTNNLFCLDTSDGSLIWNRTVRAGSMSSPAISNGRLYIGSWDSHLYCLNVNTGDHIWNYTADGGVTSSPAVADGKIYFGSYDRNLYCLNESDGSFIWNYDIGDTVNSPAVADGKVYVGSMDHNIYCIDALDGSFIWSYDIGYYAYSTPAVANGKVFTGAMHFSGGGGVFCFNASDGLLIWNYKDCGIELSSPAVADGKVFIGSQNKNLYCLDESDGSLIWKYTTGGPVSSSPSVADGKVFVGSRGGKIYCFGPQPNQPPYQPNNPDPDDGETNIDINADLSWTGGDPDGNHVNYDVYFGTTSPPPKVVSNQSSTTYDPGTLDYETKYYWQIVAWDNHGASADGPIWDFTTEEEELLPEIEIEISGGIGVNAVITNTGEDDITDLEWSINITGGILGLIDKQVSGTIPTLAAGDSETIKSGIFIGLGTISVTVTAGCAEETVAGKQFIIFTKIMEDEI